MADDVINRNNSVAEENIRPIGRPATDKFGEWSDSMLNAENVEKDLENLSPEKKEKLIKEMDEVIEEDLK